MSSPSTDRSLLIIFSKISNPGDVKTRLVPPLTKREAAQLNTAFTKDALGRHNDIPADIHLYLSGGRNEAGTHMAERWRKYLIAEHPTVKLKHQRGLDLGEKMLYAFEDALTAGYGRVVILGTDHPTLPVSFVERAFRCLEQMSPVVIGPANDGGYYLIGLNRLVPELFADMTYSHSSVLEQTLQRAAQSGTRVKVLEPWYDVDDATGLQKLMQEANLHAEQIPHTINVLDQIDIDQRLAAHLETASATR